MHKKLLIKAFEKAEKELNTNNVSPRAQHLSDIIFENSGEQYGERSLRIKFNSISSDSNKTIHIKGFVEEALSHYLGYEDYSEFIKENIENEKGKDEKVIRHLKKNKIIIIISLVLILGILIYNSTTKQRWMIWQENRYIEVKFDVKKYDINQLKFYKKERIEFFKKINANCNTDFFNKKGSVIVWYGKNNKKKLEYFSDVGLHPETGKTLKPITQYIIDKYICND